MILLWVLLIALAVGYLRGGRLTHYLQEPLRGVWLPVIALALEAAIPLWQRLLGEPSRWLPFEVLLEYALLFLFCFFNRRHKAASVLIALSSACNLLAMAANGFRMPVSPMIYENALFERFVQDIESGRLCEYVLVDYQAPLWFLGDTIPITLLSPGLASVGDFLLGAGVFLLLQRLMGTRKKGWGESMRRKRIWMSVAAGCVLLALCALLGVQWMVKRGRHGLDPKNPTYVTVWHYYNGTQKQHFDTLIERFNDGEGERQGIVVEARALSDVNSLAAAVQDALNAQVGASAPPDLFAAYADTARSILERGVLADMSPYISDEELALYVDGYVQEGYLGTEESFYLFPIAKSTEALYINMTNFEPFAQATGVTVQSLATWEGIADAAAQYYAWTDAQTSEPGDGEAFFGRDALANYLLVGSAQLGHPICPDTADGKVELDRFTLERLWTCYYEPMVKGHFTALGRFRTDDVRTGDIIAMVGSSSGSSYYPTQVTRADGTRYDIESAVYTVPQFAGSAQAYAIQQGAGMALLASNETREYAACVFLKWFTQPENNSAFALASGYVPVRKDVSSQTLLEVLDATEPAGMSPVVADALTVSMETVQNCVLYAAPPSPGAGPARRVLDAVLTEFITEDHAAYIALMEEGMSAAKAAEQVITQERFDAFVQTLQGELADYL